MGDTRQDTVQKLEKKVLMLECEIPPKQCIFGVLTNRVVTSKKECRVTVVVVKW